MKKKITFVFIGLILLVGLVVAGGVLLTRDKNVEYDKEILDALKSKGITSWEVEDFENNDYIERCLILTSPSNYSLPCSGKMNAIGLKSDERIKILDDWEKEIMIIVGNTIIRKENKIIMEKKATGTTTPTVIK